MDKRKRILGTALAAVMAFSLLAGCGNNENEPNKASGTNGNTSEQPTEISFLTYANIPFSAADSADVIEKIEEYTNTDLNVEIVPASGGEEVLNVRIASGDMPKIIATVQKSSTIINAARSGAFWEIGPYIKDYPYFNEISDITYNNISIDGKVYGLPRTRPLIRPVLNFRQDILDELGVKVPETADELLTVLKQVRDKYPDMTPILDLDQHPDWVLFPYLFSAFGAPNKWEVTESGEFVPFFEHQGFMQAMNFAKTLYTEKLLNQDFASIDQNVKAERINSGKAFSFIEAAENAYSVQETIRKTTGNANATLGFKVGLKQSDGSMMVRSLAGHNGMLIFPKSKIKDEAELRKVLDFVSKLHDEEMAMLITYGIEGAHYEMKDGAPAWLDNEDYVNRVANFTQMQSRLKFNIIEGQKSDLEKRAASVSDDFIDNAVPNPAEGLFSETYAEKGSQLDRDLSDAMIKYTMGVADEAELEGALEKWYNNGGNDMAKEYAEAYKTAQ